MISHGSNEITAEKSTESLQQHCQDELSGPRIQPLRRPYACDICGRVYARPKTLEKHRRLQHGSESDSVRSGKPVVDQSHTNGTVGDFGSDTGGDKSTETVMNHVANGTSGHVGKAYVCGECGKNFDEEFDVTSHIITKHICLSKELGSNGEILIRIIVKQSDAAELSAEDDANLPRDVDDDNDADDDNAHTSIEREETGLKSEEHESVQTVPDGISDSNVVDDEGPAENGDGTQPATVVGDGAVDPSKRDLCPVCGKTFRKLNVHLRRHRRERSSAGFECPDCGRTFSRSDGLSEHRHVHSDDRPFLCVRCGWTGKSRRKLWAHRQTHRSDDRQPQRRFECDRCGKWFRRSSGRNEHVRNVHEGRRAYRCPQCPRAYSTAPGLRRHVMAHADERPHRCPVCPKQFRSGRELKTHLVVHTGQRLYPCAVCGYRFTQRSAARVHEATQHSSDGGRRHECELCGRKFSRRSIRDAHVRRHKGQKPHSCSMCDWTFAFIGDLRNHMVKKHKVKRNAASAGRPQNSLS